MKKLVSLLTMLLVGAGLVALGVLGCAPDPQGAPVTGWTAQPTLAAAPSDPADGETVLAQATSTAQGVVFLPTPGGTPTAGVIYTPTGVIEVPSLTPTATEPPPSPTPTEVPASPTPSQESDRVQIGDLLNSSLAEQDAQMDHFFQQFVEQQLGPEAHFTGDVTGAEYYWLYYGFENPPQPHNPNQIRDDIFPEYLHGLTLGQILDRYVNSLIKEASILIDGNKVIRIPQIVGGSAQTGNVSGAAVIKDVDPDRIRSATKVFLTLNRENLLFPFGVKSVGASDSIRTAVIYSEETNTLFFVNLLNPPAWADNNPFSVVEDISQPDKPWAAIGWIYVLKGAIGGYRITDTLVTAVQGVGGSINDQIITVGFERGFFLPDIPQEIYRKSKTLIYQVNRAFTATLHCP